MKVLCVLLLVTVVVTARFLDFLPPDSDEDEWEGPFLPTIRRHQRRDVVHVTRKVCGDDVVFKIVDVCNNCAHLGIPGLTMDDAKAECCAGRCSKQLLERFCCNRNN